MSTPMETLAQELLNWSSRGEIELTDEQIQAMGDLLIHEHAQVLEVPRHDPKS